MRLLDVESDLPNVPHDGRYTPRTYAILSHTWNDEEILYSDLYDLEQAKQKKGWQKLQCARAQARKDGYRYIWVDTCCINTTSSSELSEAINSMFQWYRDAAVCYAYIEDLDDLPRSTMKRESPQATIHNPLHTQALRRCRWFTRGWTLQELIAPRKIVFFGRTWINLGDLTHHAASIAEITGISFVLLVGKEDARGEMQGPPLYRFSIAQRLSWAANRQTRRLEDRAYSLLGLLDVNMDIRYGEGSRAFIRLQEELIQRSTDQSIFAWPSNIRHADDLNRAIFASSPDAFADAGRVVGLKSSSYYVSNQGLHLIAPCIATSPGSLQLWLRCRLVNDPTKAIMLNLDVLPGPSDTGSSLSFKDSSDGGQDPVICSISSGARLALIDVDQITSKARPTSIIIQRSAIRPWEDLSRRKLFVWLKFPDAKVPVLSLLRATPPQTNKQSSIWGLAASPGRPLTCSAITMSLALDKAPVAQLRLTLRWKKNACWAHIARDDQIESESDLEEAASLQTSGELPDLVKLDQPFTTNIEIEHKRTLHVTMTLLEANEESIVLVVITHSRRMVHR